MIKTKRYIVHPLKFVVSLLTMAAALLLAICEFVISRPVSALFFIVIALLFLVTTLNNSARISIDKSGVHCNIAGLRRRSFSWEDIKEVGVFSSRLFTNSNKNRAGTLYIYFSTKPMSAQERFQMILNWSVKDKIVLQYTKERMDAVQLLWSNEIQTYNVGELHL